MRSLSVTDADGNAVPPLQRLSSGKQALATSSPVGADECLQPAASHGTSCQRRPSFSPFLPVPTGNTDHLTHPFWRNRKTNPLKSLDEINGIVERNQWICCTKSMALFRQTGFFVVPFCRFRRSFPAVLPESAGVVARCDSREGGVGVSIGGGAGDALGHHAVANAVELLVRSLLQSVHGRLAVNGVDHDALRTDGLHHL